MTNWIMSFFIRNKKKKPLTMNKEQKKLHDLLARYSSEYDLKGWYQSTIDTYSSKIKNRHISTAHFLREILNKINEEMGTISTDQSRSENKKDLKEKDKIYTHLFKAIEYFNGVAHGEGFEESEFDKKFNKAEKLLIDLLAPQINKTLKNLDFLIKQGEETESYKKSIDEFIGIIELKGKKIYFDYFFENLRSHKWIPVLKEKGFFKNPPDVDIKKTETGESWRNPYFSPFSYLSKYADKEQELSMEIVNKTNKKLKNGYIHQSFILIFSKIPTHLFKEFLKKNLRKWIANERRSYFFLDELFLLYKNCEELRGFIFNTSFDVLSNSESSGATSLNNTEFFKKVIDLHLKSFDFSFFKKIKDKVLLKPEEDYNLHYFWEKNIAEENGTFYYNKELIFLLTSYYAKALAYYFQNKTNIEAKDFEEIKILISNENTVLKRVGLYALSFVKNPPSDIKALIENTLFQFNLLRGVCSGEWTLVLKNQVNKMSTNFKSKFLDKIQTDEKIDKKEKLFVLRKVDLSEYPEIEKVRKELQDSGKYDFSDEKLYNYIRPSVRAERRSYAKESGLDFNKSIKEIQYNLDNWQPKKGNHLNETTRRDIAEDFAEHVKKNPDKYRNFDIRLNKAIFMRYFISRFPYKDSNLKDSEYKNLLELFKYVCKKTPKNNEKNEYHYHDDFDWSACRHAVAKILKNIILENINKNKNHLLDEKLDLLKELCRDESPNKDLENKKVDYYQTVINTVRGVSLESLVLFWQLIKVLFQETEIDTYEKYNLEIKKLLDESLCVKRASFCNYSVFGFYLGKLKWIDQKWTDEKIQSLKDHIIELETENKDEDLKTAKECFFAMWGTYIYWSGVFTDVFKSLEEDYTYACNNIHENNKDLIPERDTREKQEYFEAFGEHIALLLIRRLVDSRHEIIESFYRNMNEESASKVIFFIGDRLQGLKEKESTQVYQDLWDLRQKQFKLKKQKEIFKAEFTYFTKWVLYDHLDKGWFFKAFKEASKDCQSASFSREIILKFKENLDHHSKDIIDSIDYLSTNIGEKNFTFRAFNKEWKEFFTESYKIHKVKTRDILNKLIKGLGLKRDGEFYKTLLDRLEKDE